MRFWQTGRISRKKKEKKNIKNRIRYSVEFPNLFLRFSIVNLGRRLGIDCEESLYGASKKFIKRFNFIEKYADENNLDLKKLPLKEKDKLWEIAKKELP